MSLQDKIALVTGASRGIGAAIARTLGKQGAIVVGTATSASGAEKIGSALKDAGINGAGMTLNVNDSVQIEAVLKEISEKFGNVSLLINNAGITKDTLMMRMANDDWDNVISTNLSSVYRMSKAVLRPMMKARTGRIISISSVVGHMGNAGQTNYAAAKAGITGFTKSLASEVGSRGITVNCVAPGFIETDMTRPLAQAQGKTPSEMGMKLPVQGTQSTVHLLFAELEGSGHYYGSDSVRSPMHQYRAPGAPPYVGE